MTMNSGFDREISFEILEHIGVLTTYSTGWNKELNIVRWNGGQPKYDIRDWDPDHEHMSKGITIHEKEMRQIVDMMKKRRAGNRNKHDGENRKSEETFDMPISAEAAAEEPESVTAQEEAI